MYSTIFTTIATLLKPVWKWLFSFIISLIISNAVLWLLRYSASSYVTKFNDEIVEFIKEKNKELLDKIFNVSDFLNQIMDAVFQFITDTLLSLEKWIENTMTYTSGLVDQVLATIPFTDKIEQIVQDCMNSVSVLIKDQSTIFVDTFLVDPILNFSPLLDTANTRLDDLELKVSMFLMEAWLDIVTPVQTGISSAYKKVLSLSESLNGLVSFCNGSVDTMEGAMISACNQLNSYNSTLEAQKASILWTIEQELKKQGSNISPGDPGTGDPGTGDPGIGDSGGTGVDFQCIRQELENSLLITVPDGLNMDFSKFKTDPPQINPDEYLCNIQMIPNTFIFDISEFLPDFDGMNTHLSTIHTKLSDLEDSLITTLESGLPDILRGNMELKIRDLLLIALIKTLKQKKTDLLGYFENKSTELATEKEARKQEIIQVKEDIITEIQIFETDTISLIEPLLDPTVQELIDDLSQGIVDNEDTTIINTDKILPDTTEIDAIITQFDANISANENPNITDSVKWNPVDIYRILKHNFTKSDRVPLLVHLLSQDFNINADKLEELQLKWIPKA